MSAVVLVPLKSTLRGKSRLALPDGWRAAAALAMALDTVTAALRAASVGRVLLVIEDDRDALRLTDALPIGRVAVHRTAEVGLNASIADGVRAAAAAGCTGRIAVLPADLPYLAAADLDRALTAAGRGSAVVGDADGTGTTLLTAPTPDLLRPSYGPGSYLRHQRLGAVPLLSGEATSLHLDVDRMDDLASPPAGLSLGVHTARVLAQALSDSVSGASSQVTVLP